MVNASWKESNDGGRVVRGDLLNLLDHSGLVVNLEELQQVLVLKSDNQVLTACWLELNRVIGILKSHWNQRRRGLGSVVNDTGKKGGDVLAKSG